MKFIVYPDQWSIYKLLEEVYIGFDNDKLIELR